ncbi:hypothetical protein, conserved [Entamoeba dispar SAW760]|uniref:4Fe-4S ferredoxin-type domain-containing protein n=1 Tax=Entamoeba dispar (strain ATCC PRA-260 / SAW760) TaxID=370354 RepID=B0EAP5_ENTDS|nr:uncharacterized protein EDI_017160 [Entamoeba dispar SAW760]EDR28394.1 hypothetical protein, conserved [Entamoeba dispar SAW760]|eukprot:EDR28394.1 hypothetical protein, conserved [Entamoeba dispar SAW760]
MTNLTINTDVCIGCGMCTKECPCRVLKVEGGKALVDEKQSPNCMSCGHCQSICKVGAISLFEQKCEPLPDEHTSVIGAIKTRRSVRKWKGAIPNEELKELISLIKFAPSACNYRPIKFMVINRPKLTEVLSHLASRAVNLETTPEIFKPVCAYQAKVDIIGRDAPHMIIAYADDQHKEFANDDATIMLAELELALVSKGYGSFWCGFMKVLLKDPYAMEYIGLKGQHCYGCMGMGIPNVIYHHLVERKDVDITFLE